jgi:predicted HTH domain antitoxin
MRQRRTRERQREKEIKAAVAEHIAAWQAINALITRRDTEIEQLRERIAELEAAATEQVAVQRARQAAAVAAIKQHGDSDGEIAELLEITPRQVRQLLAAARIKTYNSAEGSARDQAGTSEATQSGIGRDVGPDKAAGKGLEAQDERTSWSRRDH